MGVAEKELTASGERVDGLDPSRVVCPDRMSDILGQFCMDDESSGPTQLLGAQNVCIDAGWTICPLQQYINGAMLQSPEFPVAHLVDDFAGPAWVVAFNHAWIQSPVSDLEAAGCRCCVGYADLGYRKADSRPSIPNTPAPSDGTRLR